MGIALAANYRPIEKHEQIDKFMEKNGVRAGSPVLERAAIVPVRYSADT